MIQLVCGPSCCDCPQDRVSKEFRVATYLMLVRLIGNIGRHLAMGSECVPRGVHEVTHSYVFLRLMNGLASIELQLERRRLTRDLSRSVLDSSSLQALCCVSRGQDELSTTASGAN